MLWPHCFTFVIWVSVKKGFNFNAHVVLLNAPLLHDMMACVITLIFIKCQGYGHFCFQNPTFSTVGIFQSAKGVYSIQFAVRYSFLCFTFKEGSLHISSFLPLKLIITLWWSFVLSSVSLSCYLTVLVFNPLSFPSRIIPSKFETHIGFFQRTIECNAFTVLRKMYGDSYAMASCAWLKTSLFSLTHIHFFSDDFLSLHQFLSVYRP